MSLALAVAPAALAIAASPFGIVPAILFLFTPRPRVKAGAFLGGWLLGVALGFGLAALLGAVLDDWTAPPALLWIKRGIGVLLIAYAVRQIASRSLPKKMPGWMQGIQTATTARAFHLGIILSLANPKVLLLALAAGAAAVESGLAFGAGLGASALLFATAASATVAAPLIAYSVLGARALAPLTVARDWLVANNSLVVGVVLAAIGAKLLLG